MSVTLLTSQLEMLSLKLCLLWNNWYIRVTLETSQSLMVAPYVLWAVEGFETQSLTALVIELKVLKHPLVGTHACTAGRKRKPMRRREHIIVCKSEQQQLYLPFSQLYPTTIPSLQQKETLTATARQLQGKCSNKSWRLQQFPGTSRCIAS